MTLTSQQVLLHYRLLERIGSGGMGVVWKAEDTKLGRTIALKFLPPEVAQDPLRREMFLTEARLASTLSDAGVVQVYALEHSKGLDFIAMEYVVGEPMDRRLARGALPAPEVVALGQQLARTLARAHATGLVHRDIKPANLLVTSEGQLKVVDFGLAALFTTSASAEDDRTKPPGAGSAATSGGTLAYMSPERLRSGAADASADVYALGVVLYEALSGRRPFTGLNSTELISRIVEGRPESLVTAAPGSPAALAALVERCLIADRSKRGPSAAEVERELKRIGRALELGESPALPARGWLSSLHAKGVIALAGAIAVIVAVWWLGPWRGPSLSPDTIIVFPFEVHSETPDSAGGYLGRAFAQAVAVNLAGADGLKVTTAAGNGSANDEVAQRRTARASGAERIVTGLLVVTRDSVMATVTVTDSRSGELVGGWGGRASGRDMSPIAAAAAAQLVHRFGSAPSRRYDYLLGLSGSPKMASSGVVLEVHEAAETQNVDAELDETRKLVVAFPDEPDAWALRADAFANALADRRNDASLFAGLQDAVAQLRRLDPESPYEDIVMGTLERRTGLAPSAAARFKRVLARSDLTSRARAHVLRQIGREYVDTGDTVSARRSLLESEALDPGSAAVENSLAQLSQSMGRDADAMMYARRAVELAPASAQALQMLGLQMLQAGRFQEASMLLSRASKVSRTQSVWGDYAVALLAAGHPEESIAAVATAESLPPSIYGQSNIAGYWVRARDRARALAALRRALDLGLASEEVMRDKYFDPLRGDPEFRRIAALVHERSHPK